MKCNSIRAIGLQKYLDDPDIILKHNSLGYKAFLKEATSRFTTVEMAKHFGVSRLTITKWLALLEMEKRK